MVFKIIRDKTLFWLTMITGRVQYSFLALSYIYLNSPISNDRHKL